MGSNSSMRGAGISFAYTLSSAPAAWSVSISVKRTVGCMSGACRDLLATWETNGDTKPDILLALSFNTDLLSLSPTMDILFAFDTDTGVFCLGEFSLEEERTGEVTEKNPPSNVLSSDSGLLPSTTLSSSVTELAASLSAFSLASCALFFAIISLIFNFLDFPLSSSFGRLGSISGTFDSSSTVLTSSTDTSAALASPC